MKTIKNFLQNLNGLFHFFSYIEVRMDIFKRTQFHK